MHNDTNKLKELAEAANRARRQWYTEDDCCWWTGNVDEGDFLAAANPQAILGLIAELEQSRNDLPRLVSYAEDLSTCTLTMDDGNGYFYNRVTDKDLSELDALTQEVAWLRKRLEIDHRTPYDGIACRDETIKGLDEKCGRLEAELDGCAAALPSTYYMDPPDGGDVSIPEQLRRMAKDAEVHREIQNAARDLPGAWSIQICVEQGAGWIDLFDDEGNRVEFEDFCENIGLSVKNAVQHAIEAAKQNPA